MSIDREDIFSYVKEKYDTEPDYPWENDVNSAVLRKQNKKWYSLIMRIRKDLIGMEGSEYIDVINVKCTPLVREILIGEGKAVPAYHMNKRLWITIPLNDKISMEELFGAIDESYKLVK